MSNRPTEPNISADYWKWHESTVELLAAQTSKTADQVCEELALIAGDYADMPDGEVIETFINDNKPVPAERVVFRKFPSDGAVIALFPDQYDARTGMIGSYMELGQHGDCVPIVGDTKPAEPSEYEPLRQELIRQGYTNLKVVKRLSIKR